MNLEVDKRDLDILQLALLTVGQCLKNDETAQMYFAVYEKISCQRRPCFANCQPDNCCILPSAEKYTRLKQQSAIDRATTGGDCALETDKAKISD